MKYMLMFCSTRDGQRAWEQMPDEMKRQGYEQLGRWFAEHGPKITGGNELQSPQTATTVRFQDGGEPMVHDGPFIEGNEVIGGYAEIDVADLDEALRVAKSWPARGIVEIRPVVVR